MSSSATIGIKVSTETNWSRNVVKTKISRRKKTGLGDKINTRINKRMNTDRSSQINTKINRRKNTDSSTQIHTRTNTELIVVKSSSTHQQHDTESNASMNIKVKFENNLSNSKAKPNTQPVTLLSPTFLKT